MFYDVHQDTDKYLAKQRAPGADFDEVAYADDTICITRDIMAVNKFLEAIGWEGLRYGLQRAPIITHTNANIHFKDKIKVIKVRFAT